MTMKKLSFLVADTDLGIAYLLNYFLLEAHAIIVQASCL